MLEVEDELVFIFIYVLFSFRIFNESVLSWWQCDSCMMLQYVVMETPGIELFSEIKQITKYIKFDILSLLLINNALSSLITHQKKKKIFSLFILLLFTIYLTIALHVYCFMCFYKLFTCIWQLKLNCNCNVIFFICFITLFISVPY